MTKTKQPKSKARKIFNIITSVISGIILAMIIVCLISVCVSKAKGEESNVFGYRFLYILTDSMEPDLPVGSSIVVKNCKAEDIKVGDYVSFKNDTALYEETGVRYNTHKCIEALHTDPKTGKNVIITQGINNPSADPPVEAERVQAVFVAKVPNWIGKFFSFLITPYGFATLICVPLIVLLAMQLFGQIKVIVKKEKEKSDEELIIQEINKQTEQITKDAEDYFLKEQEKIKEFLASQNKVEKKQEETEKTDNDETL